MSTPGRQRVIFGCAPVAALLAVYTLLSNANQLLGAEALPGPLARVLRPDLLPPTQDPQVRKVRLHVEDVSYTYAGGTKTRALDGLTLEVRDNEFLAIVGPVGCGKTTFLRIVAGFLSPTRGTVLCDGVPVSAPGPERGYVFQEDAIFPWMTVQDNLEFGLQAKGAAAPERAAVAAELIRLIGLQGYETAYPRDLSAGMSKMVEVARVLATDPSILIMDEPFGSLDAQTRAQMQEELYRLWEKRLKTVVLVTHDVEEAIHLADRVVVFTARPGRVKTEVAVKLPRPRALEVRLSPEFAALKRRIWAELGLT
ncbi:MAG TPA: ABC transporter ATP-binding protein [Terriglobales bacterium]|nr:ABC transporter ATP-binding protein [Terriglobales bacterium]